jgi:protein SMG7
MSSICRLLRMELGELSTGRPESSGRQERGRLPSKTGKENEKPTQVIDNGLPLFRVYSSWLVALRVELMSAEESLEPYIRDMYRNVAKTISLLCEIYGRENLAICQYLLAEDIEMIGLTPLNDSQLPPGCRLNYLDDVQRLKPPPDLYEGHVFDEHGEKLCRILDIIQCGFFLANDSKFPFTYSQTPKGLNFLFTEEDNVPQPINQATAQLSGVTESNTAGRSRPNSSQGLDQPAAIVGEYSTQPMQYSTTVADVAVTNTCQLGIPSELQITANRAATFDSEYNVDSEMLHMVNDLLEPPEAEPYHSNRTPEDIAYGMQKLNTHESSGGHGAVTPSLGSATSKTFPSLPWSYIYTPTPHRPRTTEAGADSSGDAGFSPTSGPRHSAKNSVTIQGTSLLDDPFSPGGHVKPHAVGEGASELHFQFGSSENVAAAHRLRLLQSFGNATTSPAQNNNNNLGMGYGNRSSYDAALITNTEQEYDAYNVGGNRSALSSDAFSHSSSVYHGTPCNGIAYNATTAFGRGPVTGLEDPTHYKNAIKNTSMAVADEFTSGYDQAILKSAGKGDVNDLFHTRRH